MNISRLLILNLAILLLSGVATEAQTDRANGKKNDRPGKETSTQTKVDPVQNDSAYVYEFSRPGFVYQSITIRMDENGKGNITFERNDSDEKITDPIAVSPKTIATIRAAFESLGIPERVPDLQYERDYSHLGNMTFTRRTNGKEATIKFNWTENKDGKVLMDEFRRVSNEYTWRFEMELARSTQPLRTPGIMTNIDRYLTRGEISDPTSILDYLRSLATDEKLPLMARNHADRLVKRIEKSGK